MYLSLFKCSSKVAINVSTKKENQQIGKFHQRIGGILEHIEKLEIADCDFKFQG